MRALVPVAEGFEEIEAAATIDILRRGGIEVVVAGVGGGVIRGSRGIRILADMKIDEMGAEPFDLVALPGGMPGTRNLAESPAVLAAVKSHAEAGRLVAAICAAPTVLQTCGLLDGKRVTSHDSVQDRFPRSTYVTDRVVVDGNIVTSRGAGTAVEFALKLVEILQGRPKADEIGKAIFHGVPF